MARPIRFLLDENVSNNVTEVSTSRGHEVVLSRHLAAQGTPDRVLAILGKYEALVIVSHDRDFRAYRKLLPEHERRRFSEGAGRLRLEVPNARAKTRIEEEMAAIEFHYEQAQLRKIPFMMTIRRNNIKIDTN